MTHDAIVIGLGGMGSAALYHLAARGARVLGIDPYGIAHDRGSSHGETRIIRKAYFEHPDYVPLLHSAYDGWRQLEHDTGASLYVRTGLLLVGPADGPIISGVRRSAREHELEILDLRPDELTRRWPMFRVDPDSAALFEPDAGFLWVEKCVQAYVERAVALGARIALGERIVSWLREGSGYSVKTDRQTHLADRLVFCAGAWTGRILTELNLPLEVRRKVVFWFGAEEEAYRLSRGCPVFGFESGGRFLYGFPETTPGEIKLADHTGGEVVIDPDVIDRESRPADRATVDAFIARHLTGISRNVRRTSVCMYTMTPDEHFILDRLPDHEKVWIAAGFSGHGFKFAPVVGAVLADWVLSGKTDMPVKVLSLSRFRP